MFVCVCVDSNINSLSDIQNFIKCSNRDAQDWKREIERRYIQAHTPTNTHTCTPFLILDHTHAYTHGQTHEHTHKAHASSQRGWLDEIQLRRRRRRRRRWRWRMDSRPGQAGLSLVRFSLFSSLLV